MRKISALLLLPLFAFTGFLFQSDVPAAIPATLEITGINAAAAPEVTITAAVTDSVGQNIGGLAAENFRLGGPLADNAQIVRVERVTEDNLPLAIVLVIDTSSSMAGSPLARTQAAAKAFVNALGPDDQVALVTFSNDPTILREFTADKAGVLAAIDGLGYAGQTALYDGAVTGIELAAQAPFPRRAVILLSDGAEYGGASLADRRDGPELSPIRGVPVYTIGLGYGLDRTYLQQLADASSARFYESPTPDELAAIYSDLAALLRTQYVLTLDYQGPLDGTIYPFTLRAANDAGQTNVDAAALRAPIPVPLVTVSPEPSAPVAAPVSFEATIRADQTVAQVEFSLNGAGSVDSEAPYTFDFDPFTSAPGDYTLTVRATDVDGDVGERAVPLTVAAIPSRITLDTDLSALGEISEPVLVTVSAESQTAPQSVDFRIDGMSAGAATELPATFTLDPFTLAPGPHTVEFVVTDASGAQAAITQTAQIAALAPRITVDASAIVSPLIEDTAISVQAAGQTPIETIAFTVNGVVETVSGAAADFTIRPGTIPPGEQSVTIVVTDQSGTSAAEVVAFNVGILPVVVTIEGLADGDVLDGPRDVTVSVGGQTRQAEVSLVLDAVVEATVSSEPYTFRLDPLAFGSAGPHIVGFDTVNAFGASDRQDFRVTVAESAFPSPTPPASATPDASQTAAALSLAQDATNAAQATQDAQATADVQSTVDAGLTAQAQSTTDAQATAAAILTSTARANTASLRLMTAEARATAQIQATIDAQLTEIAQQTADAVATSNAQATLDTTEAAATQDAATAAAATAAALNAQQTAFARETAQAQLTEDAQGRATAQAEMALARQATVDAVSTREAAQAVQTADAATQAADAALTAVAQAEQTMAALTASAPTETPTEEPTESPTDTPEPTLEPTVEATEIQPTPTVFDPTSTPGSPTDIIAQGGDAPDSQIALIAVCAGLVLLLLIIFFISAARNRRR